MDPVTTRAAAAASTGDIDSLFVPVRRAFDSMLEASPDLSAQVCAYWRGQRVVDLVGGRHLNARSVTGVFSVTKGAAAMVIGLLLDRGLLDLDEAVSTYWPEFAQADKQRVTVRQLLSHRAGVMGVDAGFSAAELADSSAAAALLAAGPPLWQPDSAHGYHALTIGVLMEELVRRTTGERLQDIYDRDIRAPRSIDFYLGLPESEEARFVPVLPPAVGEETPGAPGTDAPVADTLQAVAFSALHTTMAPDAGPIGPNNRAMRLSGSAAINGIGSARGLAELYAALLGGTAHPPLLSEQTIERMSRQHAFGVDRVLGHTTSFGLVFMKPHPLMEFGSYRAFGHDGAGGALAFADPLHNLAFAYVPLPMQPPGGADSRAIELSQVARRCIRAALD